MRGWVPCWASFAKLIPPYFLPGMSLREPVLVFRRSALCRLWSAVLAVVFGSVGGGPRV
ncbi:hypothetical protein Taro_046367, partial [Colocasia esculenta]|nr:hypothetical protein [Colocasia esculenta]